MYTKWIFHPLLVLSLILPVLPAQAAHAVQSDPATSTATAGLLQFSSGGHTLGFGSRGMYAATGSHALHVDFVGAHSVRPQAPGQSNAASGTVADGNPDNPQGKAAPLGQVMYAGLWDGISLSYTKQAESLYTTTYTLAPGADPADIRLRYNAPLSLNKDGSLGIRFATGSKGGGRNGGLHWPPWV